MFNQKINELAKTNNLANQFIRTNIDKIFKKFQAQVLGKRCEKIMQYIQNTIKNVEKIKKDADKIIEEGWLEKVSTKIKNIELDFKKLHPGTSKKIEKKITELPDNIKIISVDELEDETEDEAIKIH